MNRAANFIVFEILHLKRFENNTLTGHSSITMNDDWNYFSSLLITSTKEMLFSTSASHNNWVNAFKMRWVR
jgi:hypothetical protein